MTTVLERPEFRCRSCQHNQFTIIFGPRHYPVATCQSCAQSYELADRSAGPVRLIHADGRYAELPLREWES